MRIANAQRVLLVRQNRPNARRRIASGSLQPVSSCTSRQRARIRANSGPGASPRASRCRPDTASCGPTYAGSRALDRGEEPIAFRKRRAIASASCGRSGPRARRARAAPRSRAPRRAGARAGDTPRRRARARQLHGRAVVLDEREHLSGQRVRRAQPLEEAARARRSARGRANHSPVGARGTGLPKSCRARVHERGSSHPGAQLAAASSASRCTQTSPSGCQVDPARRPRARRAPGRSAAGPCCAARRGRGSAAPRAAAACRTRRAARSPGRSERSSAPHSATSSASGSIAKRAAICITRSPRSGSDPNVRGSAARSTRAARSARPPSGSRISPVSGSSPIAWIVRSRRRAAAGKSGSAGARSAEVDLAPDHAHHRERATVRDHLAEPAQHVLELGRREPEHLHVEVLRAAAGRARRAAGRARIRPPRSRARRARGSPRRSAGARRASSDRRAGERDPPSDARQAPSVGWDDGHRSPRLPALYGRRRRAAAGRCARRGAREPATDRARHPPRHAQHARGRDRHRGASGLQAELPPFKEYAGLPRDALAMPSWQTGRALVEVGAELSARARVRARAVLARAARPDPVPRQWRHAARREAGRCAPRRRRALSTQASSTR